MIKIAASDHYVFGDRINKDTYNQPRGYIAFKGPGLLTSAIQPGMDHASSYYGWPESWPGAWSSYNQVTYIRGAACSIEDYPATVLLPTITAEALSSGESSGSAFQHNAGVRSWRDVLDSSHR
ncbi:putative fimbriae; usher [Klebsiella michiganensis]|uniref:Putative fimbriae usher n=1 Tax=Klebsiella michiganensis TaxID=1134687 RepID=A0A7H4M6H2_9ENTR|nr:putative fimbriae; usher [Klebsiella michiganensis]